MTKLPFSIIFSAIFVLAGPHLNAYAVERLGSLRLNTMAKNFYTLQRDKIEHCFVESDSALNFYLSSCDKIEAQSTPHQSFGLSAPISSWLDSDIAKLKTQILESGAATAGEFKKLETLAKTDTLGRLVLVDHLGTTMPIGWISHDLDIEGRITAREVLDLCSGAYSFVCTFDPTQKRFVVEFNSKKYVAESEEELVLKEQITKVHHASVFSRGNDDFVRYHYHEAEGQGSATGKKFPLTTEWKNALASRLGSRLDPKLKQVRTPRGEPNYVTGLHPVFVIDTTDNNDKTQTRLIFGASIAYLKSGPSVQTCEDDTGSYSLTDFSLFSNRLNTPYSGRDIEKLNLSDLPEATTYVGGIYGDYASDDGFDWTTIPPFVPSPHYDIYNIGAELLISGEKAEQTYVIMKQDWRDQLPPDEFTDLARSHAVREYLELKKSDSGKWSSRLTAFNPNDHLNSNVVREDGRFWITPETISPIWNSEKGIVGKSQPFQRALAMHLKNLEKKSLEGVEDHQWLSSVADQHNKYLYDNYQPTTTHSKTGLIGHYVRSFQSFTEEGLNAIEENPAGKSIVPRVFIDGYLTGKASDLKLEDVKAADPMVLEIFMEDRAKKIASTIDEALDRIAMADDPSQQIAAEHTRAETIFDQTRDTNRFFYFFKSYVTYAEEMNALLKRVRKFPLKKRPLAYKTTQYNDNGEGREVLLPFDPRLQDLIKNNETINPQKYFAKVIEQQRELNALYTAWRRAPTPKNRDEAELKLRQKGLEFYKFIRSETHFFEESYFFQKVVEELEAGN